MFQILSCSNSGVISLKVCYCCFCCFYHCYLFTLLEQFSIAFIPSSVQPLMPLMFCLFAFIIIIVVHFSCYDRIPLSRITYKNSYLFLIVTQARRSKIKVPEDLCLMRNLFLVQKPSFAVSSLDKEQRELTGVQHETQSGGSHAYDVSNSQRPHLQMYHIEV